MDKFLGTLSACADPLRWRIIKLLAKYPDTCVCDLQALLEVPQSTLSSHLAVLRRASLVSSQKRGTWVHYSLADGLGSWLRQLEMGPFTPSADLLAQVNADALHASQHPACCVTKEESTKLAGSVNSV